MGILRKKKSPPPKKQHPFFESSETSTFRLVNFVYNVYISQEVNVSSSFQVGWLLGGSSQDGRIRGDHNHGDHFCLRIGVVGPLPPNGVLKMAYFHGGDPNYLVNYLRPSWDDPPSWGVGGGGVGSGHEDFRPGKRLTETSP